MNIELRLVGGNGKLVFMERYVVHYKNSAIID